MDVSTAVSGVVIFYLLISANFLDGLFHPDVQKILAENTYAKHLIGIITMYVSVTVGHKRVTSKHLMQTIVYYGLFYLTTLLPPPLLLLVALTLLAAYSLRTQTNNVINLTKNGTSGLPVAQM